MTLVTLNDTPILKGRLTIPCCGAWSAELITPALGVSKGDRVVISDGENDWNGTVTNQAGDFESRSSVRVVGGGGGLRVKLPAEHFRSAPVSQVLAAIASAAGESVSTIIDPSIITTILQFWSTPNETGGTSLATLADSEGVFWRVLASGNIWLGTDDIPTVPPGQAIVLDHMPESNVYTIAPEALSYTVGMLQEAGTITRVEYSIGDTLRMNYWI